MSSILDRMKWSLSKAYADKTFIADSVLTTRGDILYRNATEPARLAKGTAGQFLKQGANDPEWGKEAEASTTATGLAPIVTAPAAGLRNVVGVDNTETAYTNKALFDATAPADQTYSDAAAVGTAMTAARRDHKHGMPSIPTAASITIADAGSYYTGENVETATQEIAKYYRQPLATMPDTELLLWEGLTVFDSTNKVLQYCKTPGEQEINTLTVTGAPTKVEYNDITIGLHGVDVAVEVYGGTLDVHNCTINNGATADGDITITLNGTPKAITVANLDTAAQVAGKVTTAYAADADWTVGNADEIITFTAKAVGAKAGAFELSGGTTGVVSTLGVTETTPGVAADSINTTATKIRNETYTEWTTSGADPIVVWTKDTVGAGAAPTFTDTDSTGVTIDGAAITQTNVGVTTVWIAGERTSIASGPDTSGTPADLTITTGTGKTLVLATPVYDDIIISASNLHPGSSAPAFVEFVAPVHTMSFVNANTDMAYGSFEIPHDYKEGSAIEIHLHWAPSSTDTGDCVWKFNGVWAGMEQGAFVALPDGELTATDAGGGVAKAHQYASFGSIAGTNHKIGDIIAFELKRPAGDGFTGDAFLLSIGAHYQIDTMGSRSMAAK